MRRIWPVLLASAIGLAILVSLGVWQVKRLAWKESLISTIDKAIAGEAYPLSEMANRADKAFVKLRLVGTYLPNKTAFLLSTNKGGPAWEVLRAFQTKDGPMLVINCGKSPSPSAPSPPDGEIAIAALSKVHYPPTIRFVPDVAKKGDEFFEWNMPYMAAHLGANETGFVVDLLPGEPGSDGLDVAPPKAELRNNHLGYAITWFGLAAVLLVMTAVFMWQIRHPT
jgi:surfeit locus 1 family protein